MGKQVHFEVVEVEKAAPAPAPAWQPNRQEWTVMATIAIVSLMVALDATILVPVLPVCVPFATAFPGPSRCPLSHLPPPS